jgi:hypothetical protein
MGFDFTSSMSSVLNPTKDVEVEKLPEDPEMDEQTISTVEVVPEDEDVASPESPPAEIEVKSRDLPSEEEPMKEKMSKGGDNYDTRKIVSGIAVATGTVLIGALFAQGGSSSGSGLKRFPTKN